MFRQLVHCVVVIKGCWHLGLTTGTVDDNDGGCRECTTFSNARARGATDTCLRRLWPLHVMCLVFSVEQGKQTGKLCSSEQNVSDIFGGVRLGYACF